MPNIKSAKKRVLVNQKKNLQNRMIRSQMNTGIKKFNAAISAGDIQKAESLLPVTMSLVDSAATKGVIHKNNANNKKSQLSLAVHNLRSGKIVVKLDSKQQKQAEQKAAGAAKKLAEAKRIEEREEAKRIAAEEAAKATKKPRAKK